MSVFGGSRTGHGIDPCENLLIANKRRVIKLLILVDMI